MYGETKTKQSEKDDCDINLIMAKYIKTGVLDHVREHAPEYGFATSETFQQSMEIVAKANSMFEDLPSKIRNKFENNPAKFLDFVQDESNLEEMAEMGLANTPETSTTPPLAKNSLENNEENKKAPDPEQKTDE